MTVVRQTCEEMVEISRYLDSAADLAASARDPNNQAIYSIKKPANVFDETSDDTEALKKTFNDVLDICGISAGKKCDPSKSSVNRILMMSDGDIDGDQIAFSMVCLLAKHCKPLLDAGMVGRIMPPAYAIPVSGKKSKMEYAHTQREFFNKIMIRFIKNVDIKQGNVQFGKSDVYQLLSNNFDYDLKLDKLATRYCCSSKLMEEIVWHYHGSYDDQKKSYWMKVLAKYKDLKVLIEDGVVIIDGTVPGCDYINLAFDRHFDRHMSKVKVIQAQNDSIEGFTINGKTDQTLYDVMHTMRTYIPKGVQRFKGLGELGIDEMKTLCMNPETRKVIIFRFEDVEKDMDKINVIMSTKQKYVEARAELIQSMTLSDYDLDT